MMYTAVLEDDYKAALTRAERAEAEREHLRAALVMESKRLRGFAHGLPLDAGRARQTPQPRRDAMKADLNLLARELQDLAELGRLPDDEEAVVPGAIEMWAQGWLLTFVEMGIVPAAKHKPVEMPQPREDR